MRSIFPARGQVVRANRLPSRLRGALALAVALAVFPGCGGGSETAKENAPTTSYRYAANAPLSANVLETASHDIAIRCPAGWQETVDVKNAPHIALWIVAENYGASISFTPLQMDPALYKTLRKDGLASVTKVSLSLKRDNARDSARIVQAPESFRINGREFIAYEYSTDGGKSVLRVVLFDTGRQFVECALLPASTPVAPEENRRLFSVQQSVLTSMVLR